MKAEGSIAIRLFPTRAEAAAAHLVGVRRLLMRKFAKELAYVRRYHKIPAEFERPALYFGGREAVEKAIEEALARNVFECDIRSQAEYEAYEAEVGRTLFEKGHALTQTAVKVLGLSASLRSAAILPVAPGSPLPAAPGRRLDPFLKKERVTPEYLDAVTADLDRLVPKNFLEIYTVARLVRIPRYLEGLKIRLDRARIDPEKDRAKSTQIEPFAFELARLEGEFRRSPAPASHSGTQYQVPNSGSGPAAASTKQGQGIASANLEKRAAVDELRWMIEEFKLALFAPEIKTAFPISAVRLARKIRDIDAMV